MVRYQVKQASVVIPTLDSVKDNLRIERDDTVQDAYLTRLIDAARSYAESYLGWQIAECTVEAYLDAMPPDGMIAIAKGPAKSLTIGIRQPGANEYTPLPPADYDVSYRNEIAIIRLKKIPAVDSGFDVVRISYTAGYNSEADVPQDVIDALILRITERYLNPDNAVEYSTRLRAADQLLRHHKHAGY